MWVGGYLFTALVVVIAALAAWEMCRMASAWGQPPFAIPAIVLAAALAASGHYAAGIDLGGTIGVLVTSAALLAAIVLILASHIRQSAGTLALVTVCIPLFIGGALFNGSLLGAWSDGRDWIVFLLAVTFATDTGAYMVGKAFGSRKLAPTISPGKTWEGAIGGLLSAVAAGAIFGWAMGTFTPWLLLAPVLGVAGQLGDLYESRLKRLAGLDDSGTIFPGHGGVLDRLDSMTFNLIVLGLVGIFLL